MKLLILGATGAMGEALTGILTKLEHDVTATSRRVHASVNGEHFLLGNAKGLSFISEICNTYWDAIVDFMSYTTAEFKQRKQLFLNSTKQYVNSQGKRFNWSMLLSMSDSEQARRADWKGVTQRRSPRTYTYISTSAL